MRHRLHSLSNEARQKTYAPSKSHDHHAARPSLLHPRAEACTARSPGPRRNPSGVSRLRIAVPAQYVPVHGPAPAAPVITAFASAHCPEGLPSSIASLSDWNPLLVCVFCNVLQKEKRLILPGGIFVQVHPYPKCIVQSPRSRSPKT